MNKEERLNDYLEGYKSQYQFIGEDRIEHSLDNDIKELLQENKQLKENWNKLKENIKRRKEKFDSGLWCELDVMRMFNYLMHELEKGDSNE